jgi:hypothetical protein
LCITYPILFDLCLNQKSSVHEVATGGWVIKFKCHIHGVIREQWYELARKLNLVTLSQDNDKVIWKWSKSGKFTVKYVYDHITKRMKVLHTVEFGEQNFLSKLKSLCGQWSKEQHSPRTT